jgi:hypothetical protein
MTKLLKEYIEKGNVAGIKIIFKRQSELVTEKNIPQLAVNINQRKPRLNPGKNEF